LEHYKAFIFKLKQNNIEPFVTLWHWTFPLWAWEKAGFESSQVVKNYVEFVKKVVKFLQNDVKFWLTINEPNIYSDNSYLTGVWPPQKQSRWARNKVLRNLVKAHKLTFEAIKKINPSLQVGLATNNNYYEVKRSSLINNIIKDYVEWLKNYHFLNQVKKHIDFIGLNYYFHNVVDKGLNKNENKIVSDLGWELYPQGIYYVLKDLQAYQRPIYITENGLADAKDQHRPWYIQETIKAIGLAIQDQVDVRGYFHWSLLDNFEWADGFDPRFGLFEVDYQTFERVPRASAILYKNIIKNLYPT
jgi:beta-glucosidase